MNTNDAIAILTPIAEKGGTLQLDEHFQALDTVLASLKRLKDEREALQNDNRALTCVFCGHVYPPGTPSSNHDALAAHVAECPEHPMAALRKRHAEMYKKFIDVMALLIRVGRQVQIRTWDNFFKLDEIDRLRCGDFTVEEAHNLCHNLEMTVTAEDFCKGCEAYQKKLFGRSPTADTIESLRADLAFLHRT